MIKKKMLLCGAALLVTIGAATPALAATTQKDTEAGIGFKSDTHIPEPDPTGKLTLLWIPRYLDFGAEHETNEFTGAGKAVPMVLPKNMGAGKNEKNRYVVVSDDRDKTKTDFNWELTGELSEFESTTATLSGASLGFTPSVHDYTGTDSPELGDQISPGAATYAEMTYPTGNWNAGSSKPIMKNKGATDKGKYAFEMKDIVLNVPQGTYTAGTQYKAKITWTLDDKL